eukprot:CAMPEP_0115344110 /NCGR_PEP_ID=MMETSP0270-20121206/93089_1 /TAXON_ID=71861 /ORGANISM="Scrippsiella trochoidea, Strain CCMP3099" /LENGTH=78 /DNA_ID=CAMNT_0002765777 /DNA_START=257 /DNA_END=489 /DNA_ORIENTATION=+
MSASVCLEINCVAWSNHPSVPGCLLRVDGGLRGMPALLRPTLAVSISKLEPLDEFPLPALLLQAPVLQQAAQFPHGQA